LWGPLARGCCCSRLSAEVGARDGQVVAACAHRGERAQWEHAAGRQPTSRAGHCAGVYAGDGGRIVAQDCCVGLAARADRDSATGKEHVTQRIALNERSPHRLMPLPAGRRHSMCVCDQAEPVSGHDTLFTVTAPAPGVGLGRPRSASDAPATPKFTPVSVRVTLPAVGLRGARALVRAPTAGIGHCQTR
jgi:hypothetical protein